MFAAMGYVRLLCSVLRAAFHHLTDQAVLGFGLCNLNLSMESEAVYVFPEIVSFTVSHCAPIIVSTTQPHSGGGRVEGFSEPSV